MPVLLLLCAWGPVSLLAARGDSLSVLYTRGINTAAWGTRLGYTSSPGCKTQLQFREALLSSLIQTGTGMKWKDQNTMSLTLSRPVLPLLSLRTSAESFLYKDRQTGFGSDIATHTLSVGAAYRSRSLQVPVSAGIKNDARYGQNDTGLHYDVNAYAPHLELGDYTNTLSARHSYDKLNKRKNSDVNLSYSINRRFENNTSDSLNIGFGSMRRDYYLSSAGNIESRQEKNLRADNKLNYTVSEKIFCNIHTSLGSRTLSIYQVTDSAETLVRNREDFFTDIHSRLSLRLKPVNIFVTFRHETLDQNYAISGITGSAYANMAAPDNKSSYSTLSVSGSIKTGFDSVSVNSMIQRYRYDTPADENVDDRDELRILANISYFHPFSHTLHAEFSAGINFHHRVYIFGQRSGDNNWTRIIKCNPSLIWRPSERIQLSHRIAVLANYVSYDFEEMLPGIRSFVYRKLVSQDSLHIQVTPKNSIRVTYQAEFDENGKFLYRDWAEERLFSRTRNIIEVRNVYNPCRKVRIGTGYSWFVQEGKQYGPYVTASSSTALHYLQHGPCVEVTYRGQKMFLFAKANTLVTSTKNLDSRHITRVTLTMNWALN